ncbi:MAG: hypothetical protein QN118_11880 [Armatimonadota bacterium]|nr:hypothetical protein [Armatimonadota bacterium]MDR7414154.1 hypothetical protein [Armatimonadota bacterium]MDR7425951.1 hypothetical protein [Armatimonadota bacterium]MDR7462840.1 hypothetical protein [Armatimonadota bacterium]
MSARIEALDQRLSSRMDAPDQKVDRYLEELAGRADSVETTLGSRIEAVEQKVDRYRDRDELAVRMDALDGKLGAWLRWLVGLLATSPVAQVGVLGAAPAVGPGPPREAEWGP